MHNKKAVALILVLMICVGISGCSNKTEDKAKATTGRDSTEKMEASTDTEIFDGKKETRSFTINEPLFKEEGNYIGEYALEKENSKNILHLKGKFRIVDTMDGEVGTVTEAKLEITDACVFNDYRSKENREMNLKEFREHIGNKEFYEAQSIYITVDNGLVWLVELQN